MNLFINFLLCPKCRGTPFDNHCNRPVRELSFIHISCVCASEFPSTANTPFHEIHLSLGLPNTPYPERFSTKTLVPFWAPPACCTPTQLTVTVIAQYTGCMRSKITPPMTVRNQTLVLVKHSQWKRKSEVEGTHHLRQLDLTNTLVFNSQTCSAAYICACFKNVTSTLSCP